MKLEVLDRPDAFTIGVNCLVEHGTVRELKIRVTEASAFRETSLQNRVIVVPDGIESGVEKALESDSGYIVWCTHTKNQAGQDNYYLKIPCFRKIELHATGENRAHSLSIDAMPVATGALHPAGGAIKTRLQGKRVVKKTIQELNWTQKSEDAAHEGRIMELMEKITSWLAGTDNDEDDSKTPNEVIQRKEMVKEAIEDAKEWAIAQGPEFLAAAIPYGGQVVVGAKAVKNLAVAVRAKWTSYKMRGFEKTLTTYRLASGGRPGTPAVLFSRVTKYHDAMAKSAAKAALGRAIQFSLRFVPFSAVAVETIADTSMVVNRVVSNIREAREVKTTNWMLDQCEYYQDPEDYYHTISKGHVAVAIYIIEKYSEDEISRVRPPQDGGNVGTTNMYTKVEDAIRAQATRLKQKGADIGGDLRYRIGDDTDAARTERLKYQPNEEGFDLRPDEHGATNRRRRRFYGDADKVLICAERRASRSAAAPTIRITPDKSGDD